MLKHYFARPQTIDRIRASWIADPIERYVAWMHDHGYTPSTIQARVPVLTGILSQSSVGPSGITGGPPQRARTAPARPA